MKAIAQEFGNKNILILNPNSIMDSVMAISDFRKSNTGNIVVLIEDFDFFFTKRNSDFEIKEKGHSSIETTESIKDSSILSLSAGFNSSNQNTLFQLLDGVYSTEDTIYIATTNHKENLDSALIRYGRFDIQEELTYFDYERALKCVKLFGYDEKLLKEFNLEYPVQPAFLQSKIMEYRASLLYKEVKND